MSGKKKNMFKILGLIIAIIVLAVISIKWYLHTKEEKASQLAAEYLSQKYSEQMQFLRIRFSWIDPSLYHVYFSPVNAPDLVFETVVQQDLAIRQESTNEYGNHYSSDNYLLKFFEFYSKDIFHIKALEIWSDNINFHAVIDNPALYSFGVPIELNEKMTPDEMEQYIDYDFSASIEYRLNINNKQEEAQKMFEMIELIKNSNYNPNEVRFWYKTGKDKKDKVFTDSETWAEFYINFEHWSDIIHIEQVINVIDEQWIFLYE